MKSESSNSLFSHLKTHVRTHTHIFHKTYQHQIISIISKTLTLCYSSQHIMRPAPVCCPRQHGMVSANHKASLCIKALWLPVIKVSFPKQTQHNGGKVPLDQYFRPYVLISSDLRLNSLQQQFSFINLQLTQRKDSTWLCCLQISVSVSGVFFVFSFFGVNRLWWYFKLLEDTTTQGLYQSTAQLLLLNKLPFQLTESFPNELEVLGWQWLKLSINNLSVV